MATYNGPSADRLEWQKANQGGYEDRLAKIFEEAARRAAEAAERARLNNLAPPWMLASPSNTAAVPPVAPGWSGVSGSPDDDDTDASVLVDPIYGADAAADRLEYQADPQSMVFDDYETASKAAIASNINMQYRAIDGSVKTITPFEAYMDSLDGKPAPVDRFGARMTTARRNQARFMGEPGPDAANDPSEPEDLYVIEPGSETEYYTDPVTGEQTPIAKPALVPDRFQYDEITGEVLKNPTTGKPLLPVGVYLFHENVAVDGPPGARIEQAVDPVFMDADVLTNWALLPRDLANQVINVAYAYYGRPVDPSWVRGWWEDSVKMSQEAYQLQGQMISPLEVYDDLVAQAAAADAAASASAGGGGGYGGGGGGGNSTVNLTNYTAAKAILNAAMSQWMGRQASDSEIDQFLAQLNAQEMRNPSTVEDIGGIMVQAGGFEPQQFAEDFVKSLDGSAEFQAATTYLDAFIAALGGKAGVL